VFTFVLAKRQETSVSGLSFARTCRYVNNRDPVYAIEREVVGLQRAKEMKLGICPICGGKTERKNVDLTQTINRKIVIIKKVKAEVCSQCGERLYSEDEMKKIDVFRKKVKKGSIKLKTKREVEVYSLGY
jgi:YgiT-type zinc finger domain-containing protein